MATVTATVRVTLECENVEIPAQDMVNNFVAAINTGVPLWLASPHDPTTTMWATKARLMKVYERQPK